MAAAAARRGSATRLLLVIVVCAVMCIGMGLSLLPSPMVRPIRGGPRGSGARKAPDVTTTSSPATAATEADRRPSTPPATAVATGRNDGEPQKPSRSEGLRMLGGSSNVSAWSLVATIDDIQPGAFYRFQDVESGKWLSRALDTNVDASEAVEKVFKVYRSGRKYKGWLAVKGHTRMHLTCELSDKITVDRPWARSFEQWSFMQSALPQDLDESLESKQVFASLPGSRPELRGVVFLLKSMRNDHVISRSKRDDMGLVATAHSIRKPVYWRVFRVRACTNEVDCWGREVHFGAGPAVAGGAAASSGAAILERLAKLGPFPIIGSPKPLAHAQLDRAVSDPFDPVRISMRTMMNWASIPGVTSFQLTTDKNTQLVIDQLNQYVDANREDKNKVALCNVPLNATRRSVEFENHPKFNQPTYRGLFRRGLEAYPAAPCVMFSNGDILYTPSLSQTLERVLKFIDDRAAAVRRSGKTWHGRWMVVGQRTNHELPPSWTPRDNKAGVCNAHGFPQWVDDVEDFAAKGEKFQSNAEDYFIVSREMFDWREIPDFVVGGVAFDNWIVNKGNDMARQGTAIVIDATKTITALHQNHGHDIKDSHRTPKSLYNSELAHMHGGVGNDGHTADATVATERLPDGTITVYDKHRLLFR